MGIWAGRLIDGALEQDASRFKVDFEIANGDDLALARHGKLSPDRIRRLTLAGWIDTGSARLVLPGRAVAALGLPEAGTTRVRYADQRGGVRAVVEQAQFYLLGRSMSFNAIVEPDREDALIGSLVLETLDLLVDPFYERLIPRDPTMIFSEIG